MKKYIKILPFLALALSVGIVGYSKFNVKAVETEVIPGTVYIGSKDVSGMTRNEAEKALEAQLQGLQSTQFTLDAGENQIQVSAADIGLDISNTEVVEEALHLGKTGNLITRYKNKKDLEREPKKLPLVFTADENKIETILGVNQENLNQEAVNCGLERKNGTFSIIDGKDGVAVNVKDSAKAVQEYLAKEWNGGNDTIALVTDVTKPKGTKEELSKVKDVLGSFHTDFGSSSAGRYRNVEVGCEKINGTVIYPGEQFSVYEAVSPFDEENGYKLAGSYENGTTVQSYGGGICQVSTTLYNAAILAELQIDERFNHSMIVNYVKLSMDAAIAGTYKDLKFTNNTDAPIYIEGTSNGGRLTFSIYGEETRPSNRVVTYESETTSEINPGVVLQANGGYPVGHVSTSQSPHTGYTAKLWKVVTVNGVEQSRTEFNKSSYRASNKILTVGVATDNPEAAAQISAAIATGDEATVRNIAAQYGADPAAAAAAQAAAQQAAEAAAAQQAAEAAAAQQAAEAAAAQAAAEAAAAQQAAEAAAAQQAAEAAAQQPTG